MANNTVKAWKKIDIFTLKISGEIFTAAFILKKEKEEKFTKIFNNTLSELVYKKALPRA